jgi:hypothetical protein
MEKKLKLMLAWSHQGAISRNSSRNVFSYCTTRVDQPRFCLTAAPCFQSRLASRWGRRNKAYVWHVRALLMTISTNQQAHKKARKQRDEDLNILNSRHGVARIRFNPFLSDELKAGKFIDLAEPVCIMQK